MFNNNSFGGRQSNQQNGGVSTNTQFKRFFGETASLVLGGWNDRLNIRFLPVIGKDANGFRQYDSNKFISVALSTEQVTTLYDGYVKYMAPRIAQFATGDGSVALPISVSVRAGNGEKRSIVALEYKQDPTTGKPKYFVSLYQGLQPNSAANPESSYTYMCAENAYVTDYNPQSGEFFNEESVSSEFDVIVSILKNAVNILPIAGHSVKYANQYSSRQSSGYTGGNAGMSQGSGWNNFSGSGNNNPVAPQYTAPESTSAGFDGLPFN